MAKQNILFPVETINREIDFRIALAVMLASEDNRIFIGQHDVIHTMTKFMKHGIYVGKSVFPNSAVRETGDRYNVLKENGIRLIYLDEEGGIFRGGAAEWQQILGKQMDITRLQRDDYVCAWGEFQRQYYLSRSPSCASNIRATGHPRFDLYKPRFREYYRDDIAKLRAQYSPYVLINTSVPLANPGAGIEFSFSWLCNWDPTNPAIRVRHIAEYAHLSRILHSMISLVNRLSIELPGVKFIIRPHPTEDFDYYQAIFRGISNILVIHEGPVAPWILAGEALIHNGCTTGVEAYLAESNVVVYKCVENAEFDPFLPNTIGTTCTNEADALETIRAMVGGGAERSSSRPPEMASSLLANLDRDSFAGLLEVYQECESTTERTGTFREKEFFSTELVRSAKRSVKDLVRPYVPASLYFREGTGPRWARMFSRMFSGFREDEIRRKVEAAQRLLKRDVELKFHNSELFTIEAR